jgi:hypothetical protein
MKIDRLTQCLLFAIAIFLGIIALRPYIAPATVQAQSTEAYPLSIEPGTFMLRAPDGSRQVMGRVAIDMRNGNIWGFPTLSNDVYPTAGADTTPPTSHPFRLGKFAFADLDKQ